MKTEPAKAPERRPELERPSRTGNTGAFKIPRSLRKSLGGTTASPAERSTNSSPSLLKAAADRAKAGVAANADAALFKGGMDRLGLSTTAAGLRGTQTLQAAGPLDPAGNLQPLLELDAVRSTAEAARRDVERLNRQLAADITKLGPGLTPTQQQTYIQQFHETNRATYEGYTQATQQMAQMLDRDGPALKELALTDSMAGQVLFDSLKVVANSGSASSALTLTNSILSDPRAADSIIYGTSRTETLKNDLVGPALSNTTGTLLVQNGGDARAAFDQLQTLTNSMGAVKSTMFPGTDGPARWDSMMTNLRNIADGTPGALDTLASTALTEGGAGQAALGIGLALGGAKAGPDAANPAGEFVRAVRLVAGSGRTGLTVLRQVTRMLDEAGQLAALGGVGRMAQSLGNFGSRLVPGLGVIAGAAGLAVRADQIAQNGFDAGQAIGAIGDVAGFVASLANTVPGGQVVGMPLGIVAFGVSNLGNLISDGIHDGENRARQTELLNGIVGNPAVVERLVNGDTGSLHALATNLHLTPEQIQSQLQAYPGLVNGAGHGVSLEGLQRVAQNFGLTGDQVNGLLQTIGRNAQDPNAAMFHFLNMSTQIVSEANRPMESFIERLQPWIQDPSAPPDFVTALTNADQYLRGIMRQDERYRWDPRWQ